MNVSSTEDRKPENSVPLTNPQPYQPLDQTVLSFRPVNLRGILALRFGMEPGGSGMAAATRALAPAMKPRLKIPSYRLRVLASLPAYAFEIAFMGTVRS